MCDLSPWQELPCNGRGIKTRPNRIRDQNILAQRKKKNLRKIFWLIVAVVLILHLTYPMVMSRKIYEGPCWSEDFQNFDMENTQVVQGEICLTKQFQSKKLVMVSRPYSDGDPLFPGDIVCGNLATRPVFVYTRQNNKNDRQNLNQYNKEGSVWIQNFDGKAARNWELAEIEGYRPEGTNVMLLFRTCNTLGRLKETPWICLPSVEAFPKISSKKCFGRYLEIKLILSTKNTSKTPRISMIAIRYARHIYPLPYDLGYFDTSPPY